MQSDRAREHLEVIRTLMERSAVYRRALAPTTLLAGGVGVLAAMAGWMLQLNAPRTFVGYWLGVAVLAGIGALVMVRRQALKAHEPFWSPPTRRVAQAAAPALVEGALIGLLLLVAPLSDNPPFAQAVVAPLWVIIYGCALHSAGFFMPRGMRLFGAVLVAVGGLLLAIGWLATPAAGFGHAVMGTCFGALHLAYGIYLRFTEPREPAA
jgi:hypothetical protein